MAMVVDLGDPDSPAVGGRSTSRPAARKPSNLPFGKGIETVLVVPPRRGGLIPAARNNTFERNPLRADRCCPTQLTWVFATPIARRFVGEDTVRASALRAPDIVRGGAVMQRHFPLYRSGIVPLAQWMGGVMAWAGEVRADTVNASVQSANGIVTGRLR